MIKEEAIIAMVGSGLTVKLRHTFYLYQEGRIVGADEKGKIFNPDVSLIGMPKDGYTVVPKNDAWEECGWIKCSDRMPDEWEDVLIWAAKDENVEMAYFNNQDELKDYWQNNSFTWATDEVSYWMPLPSPPEERDKR
ncbi:MAG: hypothetical protein DRQ88_05920 [Epsilonproteobacteria bacterium]|nr:MAG: hypothetical protein DRQ88_05920 [Campylobacterota bacterium]